MALITVKLAPDEIMSDFYFTKNPLSVAKKNLPAYKTVIKIESENLEGKSAADEMFDLTNNPGRQAEREKSYGRIRSISVGDIVSVDGVDYLCDKFGWLRI